ncbi:hypothetical protein TNCV_3931521 [Trichonephila clavipes]|nr:hypothetical protein TNCV_3931521 [Trichonephila clavipes]
MANRINLSYTDIAKLIEASDSEEVSENEDHTSDEIESESSDKEFDTNNQQMNHKDSQQHPKKEQECYSYEHFTSRGKEFSNRPDKKP